MSYRCNVCRNVAPSGQSRLVHRVTRDRLRPNGTVVRETAAEYAVCAVCSLKLSHGYTLSEIVAQHAASHDLAAPEYRHGEPREPLVVNHADGNPLNNEVDNLTAVLEPVPALLAGLLFSLFTRYGAASYWEARFADAEAETVANEVARHWHLRKLWEKVYDLVPTSRKRRVIRPQPGQHVAVPRSSDLDMRPVELK